MPLIHGLVSVYVFQTGFLLSMKAPIPSSASGIFMLLTMTSLKARRQQLDATRIRQALTCPYAYAATRSSMLACL
eukprot:768621-Hanusia_phi.AAC.2